MIIARAIKFGLHKVGLDLRWHRPASPRRIALMKAAGVRSVLDVGANTGQYATDLRKSGFAGDIISFEPLDEAYRVLVDASAGDDRWQCRQLAASDHPGTSTIHIAGNEGASSSLLVMADAHIEAMPVARTVGVQEVTMCRLDSLDELRTVPGPLMLKLDVQGHELPALAGAEGLLDRVVLIEAELSVSELYEGGPLMLDVLSEIAKRGFDLVALEPGFYHPGDGRFLQFDGTFRRVDATPRITERSTP